MKKALATILFLTLCSSGVLAQNDEYLNANIIPSVTSPQVADLGKHISVPVSLNTGTPSITIPIYILKYGGMQVPITLNYDATGVRVTEMASPVGLKWNLNVGGAVSRIVRGAPDEGIFYFPVEISAIPCYGFYRDYGLTSYVPFINNILGNLEAGLENSSFMIDLANGYKDAEPDLFSFNALGNTGRFYFNDNREIVPYLNKDYTIKEYYDPNAYQNKFTKWEVTSPNGIIMTFGENNIIEKSYSSEMGNYPNYYQTNSWFLNQLKNNSNNKSISFEYEEEQYSNSTLNNTSFSTYFYTDYQPGLNYLPYPQPISTRYNNALTSNNPQPVYTESSINTNRIKTITAGDIRIEFIASNRDDLYKPAQWNDMPKKIDEIIIYDGLNCIKKIQFEYDYFTSTTVNYYSPTTSGQFDKGKKRLKLLKVKEVDCNNNILKEFSFEYHEENSLPPIMSFAQDKWGFYNGSNNNQSLFPAYDNNSNFPRMGDRVVREQFTRLGSLKKIIYPTGGSTEFIYENHRVDTPENLDPTAPETWQTTTSANSLTTTGAYIEKTFTFQNNPNYKVEAKINGWGSYPGDLNSCVCGSPQDQSYNLGTSYEFIDEITGNVIVSKTFDEIRGLMENNYNCSSPSNIEKIITVDSNDGLVSGRSYKIRAYNYFNSNTSSTSRCFNTQVTVSNLVQILTPEDFLIGGLRIKETKFVDTDNTIVKTNTYTYETPNLISNPEYIYPLRWDVDLTYNGLFDLYDLSNISDVNIYLYMLKNNFLFEKGDYDLITPSTSPQRLDFMGSHISYDKVTEVNSEGKTEYSYYPAKTYFEQSGYSGSNIFPFPPLLQSNKSGKLLAKRTYDKFNQMVAERIDIYTNTTDWNNETKALSVSNVGGGQFIYPHTFYSLYPEYLSLQSSTTKQFLGGQEVSTTTNYFYEGNGHNQTTKVVTTNSLGEQLESQSLYAPDVNNTTLIAQNRIVPPIETTTYNDSQILQKQTTNYTTFGSLYLPNSVDVTKGAGSTETRVLYEKYDSYGNLLQYRKTNGSPISFIWGYNGQYPIAKVENATYANIEALSVFGTNFTIVNNLSASQETALRGLSNTMVTTYVYTPLVGITSVTDPKGYTSTYDYDAFNRLIQVKDADGNIVSKNSYHYKGQQ